MAKMFVTYSKTKAEFISAGLATTYNNSIVFIKGDAQGNGSCIYTHGQYFANFSEFINAINYVKGVNVDGKNYNAAAGGGYVAFNATDPSTVAVNAGQNGINIGLTTEFVNKVNNTATNLGTTSDSASASGSAFARIANLAGLIASLQGEGTGSVSEQITSAVNALRTEIVGTLGTDDSKTLAAINDELDSIISNYNTLKGRVDTIESDYLKSSDKTELQGNIDKKVAQSDYDTKIAALEKADTDNLKTAKDYTDSLANGAVKANTDAIAKLNGNASAEGSIAKQIQDAINEFAGTADADNVIENVTELLNYVSGVDGSKTLSEAIAQIAENKGKIETLNGSNTTAGSVAKQVKDAIDSEVNRANAAYATAAQGAKADSAVQTVVTGTTNGTIKVDGTDVAVKGLGSAAYTESTAYATSAQGGKADSALQSISKGTDGTYVTTTVTNKSNNTQTIGVSVTTKAVANATSTDNGLATAYDAKSYADNLFVWEEL
jgi:hypothetical protein